MTSRRGPRRAVARGRRSPTRWCRPIGYPPLPVAERRDDLLAAMREHQVVVVAGETGSGKTTQLPKICLELGRGVARPDRPHPAAPDRRARGRRAGRRGARRPSSAALVGYQVRFTDRTSARHPGQADDRRHPAGRDRSATAMLRRYDTLIIDEAHERSLNIDFLLGYLAAAAAAAPRPQARSSPRRPSTSSGSRRHFGGAPVVEVSGRTYPVEIRYRPLDRAAATDDEDDSVPRGARATRSQAICDAVDELAREGPGDVLVFLPGEREIRDTAEALRDAWHLRDAEVLPLYARLSPAEQHRVFRPHAGAPDRAGHQRGGDLADRARHPLRGRHRHGAHQPLQPAAPRCSGCRSSRSRRPPPTSARAAAAASRPASASGSTARRTSTAGRSSPIRRSCAPTWRR